MVTATGGSDLRCPGVLHAVAARDGMLARIRIPGGVLSGAQLRAVAEAAARCGSGLIDVTARANLQVRGLAAATLPDFAQRLVKAGLLPSARHERVRNIVASPFAGIDPDQLLDVRPFVRALDAGLIGDPLLADLPAKFLFAVDGGERTWGLAGADLCIRAVESAAGTLFHLEIGGRQTGYGVRPLDAISVLLGAARAALEFAARSAPARRWRLAKLPDADAFIRERLGPLLRLPQRSRVAETPQTPGIVRARRPGSATVVPTIPLGRIDAAQALALADLIDRHGIDLRLAPWRGIVLGDVRREVLGEVTAELAGMRLDVDGAGGYWGVAACTGTEGCDAALADVRRDAADFARRRGEAHAKMLPTVHFSGCEKRCGMRRDTSLTFVAGERGYDVALNGAVISSGVRVAEALRVAEGIR